MTLVQIGIGLVFLFLFQYILPAYVYIIEHSIFLLPVGILVVAII